MGGSHHPRCDAHPYHGGPPVLLIPRHYSRFPQRGGCGVPLLYLYLGCHSLWVGLFFSSPIHHTIALAGRQIDMGVFSSWFLLTSTLFLARCRGLTIPSVPECVSRRDAVCADTVTHELCRICTGDLCRPSRRSVDSPSIRDYVHSGILVRGSSAMKGCMFLNLCCVVASTLF